VHKDTAVHGGFEKFSGECKGPPEAIIPMPTLVGIDFAAAGHDFAAAVPRASRRYPGSNNGDAMCVVRMDTCKKTVFCWIRVRKLSMQGYMFYRLKTSS